MTGEERLASHGYKLVTRAEFDAAADVPAGMREIAARVLVRWGGDFVAYDPAGGDDGWLLIDDDRDQVIGETIEHLGRAPAEPAPAPAAQGSLF
jgi:hypothetical protein